MDHPHPQYEFVRLDQIGEDALSIWKRQLITVNVPPLLSDMAKSRLDLDTFDPKELASLAARDPVLGAKLLAVANSAKFGLTTPMTSIQRAVVHLGYNLVKTIMVAYQLESAFGKMAAIPPAHLEYVRRWSSGASVIAFHWSQAADLPDASTIATAALLARLGTLLIGMASPRPTADYLQLPDEQVRLEYEATVWKISSPVLGQFIAQHWGLPDQLSTIIARQWEPLALEMPVDPTSRCLTLVCASLALAESYLRVSDTRPGFMLDLPAYRRLKSNAADNKLIDDLHVCWSSARMQRELASATAE